MSYLLLFILKSNTMKKILLFCLVLVNGFFVSGQVLQKFPAGFQKANVPGWLKNYHTKVPYREAGIDNQAPFTTQTIPRNIARFSNTTPADETWVGDTYYDLQTNHSISNHLCVNHDGTISAAWNYSPNAQTTTTPPYPQRGSGYNYWDGTNLLYPIGPVSRQENFRTGFTNIVVTPVSELLISHASVGATGSNQIAVTMRMGKGAGPWTTSYPWGQAYDSWPKAVAAGSNGANNNVYVIFQGSGNSSTSSSPNIIAGQNGPIYFSRSTDGGISWEPKRIIDLIDSNYYAGFSGDCYSIDARGNDVAISFGEMTTDVGILKSTDGGVTWTKKIIQKHPIPFYAFCNCATFYIPNAQDTVVDTVYSNSGDSKILIDNSGMCHVWFSDFNYHDADSLDGYYNRHDGTDGLSYWNETMAEDTGGARSYVTIAAAQDFNGNGIIDFATGDSTDTTVFCTTRVLTGQYGGGITIMPSAGIDASGRIYLTYATIDESADTSFFELYRHIYMMTLAPPYNPADWSYPYDIIPSIANGGNGRHQEGAFACTGRFVDSLYAYVLYQRDTVPGHSISPLGTCDHINNFGNPNDIILTKVSTATVGLLTNNQNELFVSQNYPNPATGMTYININLKKSTDLQFEVYDIIGKNVYSETRKRLDAGNHTIPFNTANLEPGIYNYTVIAGGQKASRQMIVQK